MSVIRTPIQLMDTLLSCNGKIPAENNVEITLCLVSFPMCVPNSCIMGHKCPAHSQVPTSRVLSFKGSRA